MATKPRTYSDSGWYHVYNRGARHQSIFHDDADRQLFVELLADLVRAGVMRCHASCLMGNHYHLVIEADGTDISRGIKALAGQYVQKFNRRHGFDGPLFRSRFGSTAIEGDEHLLETIRYVHNNPVDIGQHVSSYPWSTHRQYLSPPLAAPWLERAHVMGYFNGDVRAYQSFVEGTPYQWAS